MKRLEKPCKYHKCDKMVPNKKTGIYRDYCGYSCFRGEQKVNQKLDQYIK